LYLAATPLGIRQAWCRLPLTTGCRRRASGIRLGDRELKINSLSGLAECLVPRFVVAPLGNAR